jgi:CheY-like chemotaxis protein
MNLCLNAAQAMKAQGGLLRITLSKVRQNLDLASEDDGPPPGHYVLLEISDTGPGIAAPDLPHIFEPFFTTKPIGEGSGLGLAVVHGIVQGHEGRVTVHSQVGAGTTFFVWLPAIIGSTALAPGSLGGFRGTGRVLVVDDEEAVTTSLQLLLERMGFSVTTFRDPMSALAWFLQDPSVVDYVVTDMRMPDLTGIDLAERIHQRRPDIPIALISGYLGGWSEDRILARGIRAVGTKPLTLSTLEELMRTLATTP